MGARQAKPTIGLMAPVLTRPRLQFVDQLETVVHKGAQAVGGVVRPKGKGVVPPHRHERGFQPVDIPAFMQNAGIRPGIVGMGVRDDQNFLPLPKSFPCDIPGEPLL